MGNSLAKTITLAPETFGVYLFSNQKKETIYVGKAINLRSRLQSYNDPKLQGKTALMVKEAKNLKYIQVFSEIEALILEATLIKKYQPVYNLRLKDDKSFLYIAVTKEEFPKILAVRKKDLPNPKYLFGPFPSAKTVHSVISYLRKIYPFCQQKTNRRPCFWSHIGLCNPCPGYIEQQNNLQVKQQLKKNYLNNIKNLVSVLNGKSKNLLSNLTKEMSLAVKLEDFERAALYRNQIQKLNYVTHNPHSLSSFLESPNFFEEEQKKELKELSRVIPMPIGIQRLTRIECYDISNLQGQFATGSMVVFINGVADKSQYRRFKIKNQGQPNDVEMMGEMIERRMKHQEWSKPDLIVVDGGKGQVSAALSVIASHDVTSRRDNLLSIPVIGLAKRLETIILPQNEINLPLNSPALNLLKRIRDEAHRFAIAYHRQLRKKSFLFAEKLCLFD